MSSNFCDPFQLVKIIIHFVGLFLLYWGNNGVPAGQFSFFLLIMDSILLGAYILLMLFGNVDSYRNTFIYFFVILTVYYLPICSNATNNNNSQGSMIVGIGAIVRVCLNFIVFIVFGSGYGGSSKVSPRSGRR